MIIVSVWQFSYKRLVTTPERERRPVEEKALLGRRRSAVLAHQLLSPVTNEGHKLGRF